VTQRHRHLNARRQRPKRSAIGDDDVHAAALLVLEHRRARREANWHKTHARNAALIEIIRQLVAVNPRRADEFKRRVGPPTN